MIEGSTAVNTARKLRYGMVGGGKGAFIGDVHRKAIAMDGLAELVAGSFSQSFDNTIETGTNLGLARERLYATYAEMAQKEASRPDCIDFVSIVTPNALHYPVAKAFLEAGINVVCDKPLTFEESEARELEALARKKNLLFCVTYTYTGYPAVKQAREMVQHGDIGEIRFVNAEYPQEWLATAAEREGSKQASWRTNPALSGKSNCVGDIGSHVENLVSYITGLKIKSLCARLDTFVSGRVLDDNASIMVEYEGGAKGLYWASQITIGYDNALRVRIFGTKGTIQWSQENPNYLTVSKLGEPTQVLSRGAIHSIHMRSAIRAYPQAMLRVTLKRLQICTRPLLLRCLRKSQASRLPKTTSIFRPRKKVRSVCALLASVLRVRKKAQHGLRFNYAHGLCAC